MFDFKNCVTKIMSQYIPNITLFQTAVMYIQIYRMFHDSLS